MSPQVAIDRARIEEFCRKWGIVELSLFGSALGEDFGPESDVDVLVQLKADAPWDAFHWVDMIEELRAIFGRDVDLVEKTAIRNPFRRHHILSHREIVYAAG
jgi:predicted nucleotidyltransferase